ncbi:MAG: thioesterase family protein [Aeromicrobium sp.]
MNDYDLQLRWADLDALNHVNNVRYVDYALEATGQLIADGIHSADLTITRIDVDFLRPMMLSLKPIRVSSVVSGGQIVQEICAGDAVFARVTTDFGTRTSRAVDGHEGAVYPAQLRRSDFDSSTGVMTPAKLFELFQECRLLYFAELMRANVAEGYLVAKIVADFHQPVIWRPQPWPITSWVSKVGNSSIGICAQIADGDTVLAYYDTVLVCFDLETQKSRALTGGEKARLRASLS